MEYEYRGKTIKVEGIKFSNTNYIATIYVDGKRVKGITKSTADECNYAVMKWLNDFECCGIIR